MLHQCTQCDYNSKVKCNVKRHMKVHVKRNEAHPTTKRKHDEDNTHEEDQPMIKKKWYVLDDDELEKRIYKILYDVKVIKEEMNDKESENYKDKKELEFEDNIEVEKDKIDDEDEHEIDVEEGEDKKLLPDYLYYYICIISFLYYVLHFFSHALSYVFEHYILLYYYNHIVHIDIVSDHVFFQYDL